MHLFRIPAGKPVFTFDPTPAAEYLYHIDNCVQGATPAPLHEPLVFEREDILADPVSAHNGTYDSRLSPGLVKLASTCYIFNAPDGGAVAVWEKDIEVV